MALAERRFRQHSMRNSKKVSRESSNAWAPILSSYRMSMPLPNPTNLFKYIRPQNDVATPLRTRGKAHNLCNRHRPRSEPRADHAKHPGIRRALRRRDPQSRRKRVQKREEERVGKGQTRSNAKLFILHCDGRDSKVMPPTLRTLVSMYTIPTRL